MSNPLVSIIIPAHNAAAFLEQTIASAQNQTYRKIEIIVVDDAATDETFAVASRRAEQDKRIRILRHEKNSGLSATRNTGIQAAQGEWIAFLDADDLFLPRKIELQLNLWRDDSSANLLFTNYWNWDGEKDLGLRYKKRTRFPDGDVSIPLCFENQFCPSTVMLRRETLESVGGFNVSLPAVEDWDLWLRIAEKGLKARGVWEPQVRYRVWAGNMSKNSEKMTCCIITVLESALSRPQPAERRFHFRRSLNHARAQREFSLARKFVGQDARSLAAAIFRAWRFRPLRLKWLLWSIAVLWPDSFGGKRISAPVHRRILEK